MTAARRALVENDATLILPFVPAPAEAELRRAFKAAMEARKAGPHAAHVAEEWFFETAVRLHRAGEGAAFEGLKPAGLDVGPIVPLAEKAIHDRNADELVRTLTAALEDALRARFDEAMKLRAYRKGDVAGARAYTSAMLDFILFSHGIFGKLAGGHEHEHAERPLEAAQSHAH